MYYTNNDSIKFTDYFKLKTKIWRENKHQMIDNFIQNPYIILTRIMWPRADARLIHLFHEADHVCENKMQEFSSFFYILLSWSVDNSRRWIRLVHFNVRFFRFVWLLHSSFWLQVSRSVCVCVCKCNCIRGYDVFINRSWWCHAG